MNQASTLWVLSLEYNWVCTGLQHHTLEFDSIGGELKAHGVQGTVVESIGRTWTRKGFLGFFSGNSAGSPASLIAPMLLNQVF